MDVDVLYERLMSLYGPQGWWPLTGHSGSNPTKTGSSTGYHPGDYRFPKSRTQRFEIGVGAILTQNTNWVNAERALFQLKNDGLLDARIVSATSLSRIAAAIRPAGYFNQKAQYLKEWAKFFCSLRGVPSREQVLSIKGVGPETADSILLYAYGIPVFVVDAYTKRVFSAHGVCDERATYRVVQDAVHMTLGERPDAVEVFQEFHALLVEHAKRHYSKKPYGVTCPLQ